MEGGTMESRIKIKRKTIKKEKNYIKEKEKNR